MAETTQSRGRGRPKGTESTHVMIRMPNDLLTQIDAYAETLEAQIGMSDVSVSRAMAVRELCKKGLQSLTSAPPASQPQTLQPYTTPEPAPASHTNGQGAPALAVAMPQAAETPTPRARRPASHALSPATLQAIADERTHCEGLSLRDFAKRLHEKVSILRQPRTEAVCQPIQATSQSGWSRHGQ